MQIWFLVYVVFKIELLELLVDCEQYRLKINVMSFSPINRPLFKLTTNQNLRSGIPRTQGLYNEDAMLCSPGPILHSHTYERNKLILQYLKTRHSKYYTMYVRIIIICSVHILIEYYSVYLKYYWIS